MKVKLLKDLPFCKAGAVAKEENNLICFHNSNAFKEEEILNNPEWFEVIKELPIWWDEDWRIGGSKGEYVSLEVKTQKSGWRELGWKAFFKRSRLIMFAPKMWRMLHAMATNKRVDKEEIQELLNEIGV